MKKIDFKSFSVVSLTLFAMFFGAGNFIFPPFLGNTAGTSTPIAILAFCLTAVVFPVLGIAACAKASGMHNLASRVSRKFAMVFGIGLLLIIGPIFAIPRAANMPYELAIKPFLSTDLSGSLIPLFIYSVTYFIINWALSINPTKMISTLGKILTPILLVLILLLITSSIINPMHSGAILEPRGGYAINPIATGILEGYQTMDALASLSFGLVILLTFKRIGISDNKVIINATIKAGVLAGILLAIIYISLSYIGVSSAHLIPNPQNGAEILTVATNYFYGKWGVIIFGISIFLACITTTVGLTCAISEYFVNMSKISYKTWIVIWSLLSSLIANIGLTAIINYAVPFLGIIYPLALTLIVLSLMNDFLRSDKFTYRLTCYTVLTVSLIGTLDRNFDITLPILTKVFSKLPLYVQSLEWILPAF
ncbi:MAG: branched-chain amino acid transport system II carrier protein, partial [Campylobacter sp.]|nr:branched-chain amino acid transport system II carrier protein [Campylobacter sp.]